MARQKSSTAFAQESSRPISQVALYARVSTLNHQDPELQLAELREYAGRRGWQIVEEFTDQGVSGCKESRPALNRLMSDACRRRFDGKCKSKHILDTLNPQRHLIGKFSGSKYSCLRPRRITAG